MQPMFAMLCVCVVTVVGAGWMDPVSGSDQMWIRTDEVRWWHDEHTAQWARPGHGSWSCTAQRLALAGSKPGDVVTLGSLLPHCLPQPPSQPLLAKLGLLSSIRRATDQRPHHCTPGHGDDILPPYLHFLYNPQLSHYCYFISDFIQSFNL